MIAPVIMEGSGAQDVAMPDIAGKFVWGFGQEFYIEADDGKQYIWSSPEYGGDDSFKDAQLTYAEWVGPDWGRDKGKHVIKNFCRQTASNY